MNVLQFNSDKVILYNIQKINEGEKSFFFAKLKKKDMSKV